jgi:hemoglobin/transferrin/lactoferrin receptor protein
MWSQDRSDPAVKLPEMDYSTAAFREGGFSPSFGVTVEPIKGTQFYANYSSTLRAPSIMESVTAFSMNVNADTKSERSNNWELGVNLIEDSLFAGSDQTMVKLGYFNWDVQNYIAREWYRDPNKIYPGMRIINIDRARFSGLELSTRYELGGFSAELAANYYLNVEFCRTADSCEDKSLYADYSTNAVPPKYGIDLTLSQKLMEDALTLGGRISHVSSRAIGHGDATAQGMSQFIRLIEWEPYTLVDIFAEYKINDNYTASVRVENLTDQYYVDPLSLVQQPGPGRTFYASLTASF